MKMKFSYKWDEFRKFKNYIADVLDIKVTDITVEERNGDDIVYIKGKFFAYVGLIESECEDGNDWLKARFKSVFKESVDG